MRASRKSSSRVLGLTGGIAAGKSTVSALLTELGCKVICADALARRVVAPGSPALAEIARRFGPEYLDAHGALDRARMGELVFHDADARRALEAILHPRIRQAFAADVAAIRAADPRAVIVYDAPLLLEVGADKEVERVIVVHVPRAIQVARLMHRDGLTEDAALRRIDAQMPAEERLRAADHVLDGTAPPDLLRHQLAAIVAALDGPDAGAP
ncbi:MAG: dephospho-CoA kinase [Nitrospirae bacterium]|nr:dephospho-CoA kinase [Nitrospirota bacterium]